MKQFLLAILLLFGSQSYLYADTTTLKPSSNITLTWTADTSDYSKISDGSDATYNHADKDDDNLAEEFGCGTVSGASVITAVTVRLRVSGQGNGLTLSARFKVGAVTESWQSWDISNIYPETRWVTYTYYGSWTPGTFEIHIKTGDMAVGTHIYLGEAELIVQTATTNLKGGNFQGGNYGMD
jgi:hypothetical protein